MTMDRRISCRESEEVRAGLRVYSSCTNFNRGQALDSARPHHNHTEWCDDDEVVRLIDVLDKDGCRHTIPGGEETT